MAANIDPIYVLASNCKGVTFVNADGTAKKTLFTAGANGSLLTDLNITSDDTALMNLDLFLKDGTTSFALGTIPVAIGAGTTAASNAVNGLDAAKLPGLAADGTLWLPTLWTLEGAVKVAVTAAKTVTVLALGGDY
jgi:hypothetical protein